LDKAKLRRLFNDKNRAVTTQLILASALPFALAAGAEIYGHGYQEGAALPASTAPESSEVALITDSTDSGLSALPDLGPVLSGGERVSTPSTNGMSAEGDLSGPVARVSGPALPLASTPTLPSKSEITELVHPADRVTALPAADGAGTLLLKEPWKVEKPSPATSLVSPIRDVTAAPASVARQDAAGLAALPDNALPSVSAHTRPMSPAKSAPADTALVTSTPEVLLPAPSSASAHQEVSKRAVRFDDKKDGGCPPRELVEESGLLEEGTETDWITGEPLKDYKNLDEGDPQYAFMREIGSVAGEVPGDLLGLRKRLCGVIDDCQAKMILSQLSPT